MDLYVAIGLALTIAAEVLAILSTALPYWFSASLDNGKVNVHAGLFKLCANDLGTGFVCVDYDGWLGLGPGGVPGWLKVAQAMMILSVIAFAGGIVLASMYVAKVRDWVMLIVASAALTMAGVAFGVVGTSVAGSKFNELTPPDDPATGNLHAAFGLGVVAVLNAAAAAISLGLAWIKIVKS
ncbi:uncharacterized protein LOC128228928 [Mya arenaria]|nr:uncharacterized protein LOC128228928 [Mya arenaria]XP_052796449.1 uncharacterized protein LOC128228928 [Mya arenaria]